MFDEFFVTPESMDNTESNMFSDEDKQKVVQNKATERQKKRDESLGQLLRSKGFIWVSTWHNIMASWQQAGNMIRIEAESPWLCDMEDSWRDNPEVAEAANKKMMKPNGEPWEYQDRRQELVFIGQGLKHDFIQKILDQCLLTDEEMLDGPENWKKMMAGYDTLHLSLDRDESDQIPLERSLIPECSYLQDSWCSCS